MTGALTEVSTARETMVGRVAGLLLLTVAACGAAVAQERPIVGQDPADADRGRGPTGWVQAPTPRGYNAPQQAAQGAGAGAVTGGARMEGGQVGPADNPGTPVPNPLPGPSGAAQAAPSR